MGFKNSDIWNISKNSLDKTHERTLCVESHDI